MSALVLLALAASAPATLQDLGGVTKDGRYFAWTGHDGDDGPVAAVVQDLFTGAQKVYATSWEDSSNPGFEEWLKKHPLVALRASRTSPDGKAVADVVASNVTQAGAWTSAVNPSGGDMIDTWSDGSATGWSLVVTRGGAQQVVAHCAPADSLDVYWTPDGKRTLWVAHHFSRAMRDPGFEEIVVGTDGSPGVSVAVDKAKLKEAEKVSVALAKAGFTVLKVTAAKKPRDKSVVFAAAGREADAKKLAAAVPGGAEVQKLDWKSPQDLVVALGPDALK
jgi:hypothetical protein